MSSQKKDLKKLDKKTILIIEDEPDIRAVYTEVLSSEGFGMLEAEDGKEGLELALAGEWDLMLLDVMIPVLDGLGILKIIKGTDTVKDKPIILLTNIGNANLISESFELGAAGYLIKAEITPDKILNEVKNYLS